ncbi:LysR family transcriptional regulator [Enterocloster lavalensis]|uniref:LysR family transcriptional regulator n=1 Tax=Enterocloster lavalensis TaxID=460384 RepID=UPI0023F3E2AC|nr:LysR family transcriptional regulator [Enterocloster lavalensis]
MTIQQMKYFIAVADSGSISEAAKRLYAAQSSVSSAIKEIEFYYGNTAFSRESKGACLTKEGEELLIEFKGILTRLEFLDEKYLGKHRSYQGFSVSAQHHICGMDSFISAINSVEGETYEFGFYECKTLEILERVDRGMDDLGIIFFSGQRREQMMQEFRNRHLTYHHLSYKKAHIYLSQTHPLAKYQEIPMEELEQYPYVAYDRTSEANLAYTDRAPFLRLKKIIYVSDRASTYSLLRWCNGFVVGSGYHSSDRYYSDIVCRPLQNGIDLDVGWVAKNKRILPEIAGRFINLMASRELGREEQ